MSDTGLRHRLMAILAADAAGYSRLMAADEHSTLADLDAAREVFKRCIADHHGHVVDTAGDSVLAVFETAAGAIDAALAIQQQLAAGSIDSHEDRRMRFRIGIHLGDVIEKPDGSVYGNGVNVAARLQALAEPGGISVSEAVRSTLGESSSRRFDDQGEHSVKNIAAPVRVYQLPKQVEPLAVALTAANGLAAPLPFATSPLIGRAADITSLVRLLDEHRVVTVVGAGGIGKTSVALAAAHDKCAARPQRAVWVELAPISDPTLLPPKVAHVLGLPVGRGDHPLRALVAGLRSLDALLVLDNAEHLLEEVARLVQAVAAGAPGMRFLVTSQAPLRVGGEHVFKLDGLAVPPPDIPAAEAPDYGAVALFVSQAQTADRRFALTGANVAEVIALCRRLDGNALALKLAAARLPLFGLGGLNSRMAERLRVLDAGERDAPPRQHTLRAALDWSYRLLSEQEQALFRRLGVFVGGFTLELVTHVASEGQGEAPIVNALAALVDRSLVTTDGADPPRFGLLESPREYAQVLLAEANEVLAARRRHAQAVTAQFERADESFWAMPDARWLADIAPELDNMRAALVWSSKHAPQQALALAGHAANAFFMLGLSHEHRRRSATLAPLLTGDTDRRVAACFRLGQAITQGWSDYRAMHDCAAQAATLYRELGDSRGLFLSLVYIVASCLARDDEIDSLSAEIDRLCRLERSPRVPLYRLLANFDRFVHGGRQAATADGGQTARRAIELAEQGLALAAQAGAATIQTILRSLLVHTDITLGHRDKALSGALELLARERARRGGLLIVALGALARAFLMRKEDRKDARSTLVQLFSCCRSAEWEGFGAFSGLYVWSALCDSRYEAAARLIGFSDMFARRRGWRSRLSAEGRTKACAALLAAGLDATTIDKLIAEGTEMDEESVCLLTLGENAPDETGSP